MADHIHNGSAAGQLGSNNTQNNYFHGAQPPQARWPYQVGVIPPRVGAFQERDERARLHQALAGGRTPVPGRTAPEPGTGQILLSGMGGVGKTQLAADYAHTAWATGELDLLVWVSAVDRASLVAGLGSAGVQVSGADGGDPLAAAEAFVAWLQAKAGRDPCRWLVVLDDVSDPSDLEGLWPPYSPTGRALITTRRRDAAFTHDGRTRRGHRDGRQRCPARAAPPQPRRPHPPRSLPHRARPRPHPARRPRDPHP